MEKTIKELYDFADKKKEELTAYINDSHEEYYEGTALFEARNLAQLNRPVADDASRDPYTLSFVGKYEGLKAYICLQLAAGIRDILDRAIGVSITEQVSVIENFIRERVEKIRVKEVDKGRIHIQKDYSRLVAYRWWLIPMALGECFWTTMSFVDVFNDTYIEGIFAGIVVGFFQIFGVKAFTQRFKEIEHPAKRKAFAIGSGALFGFISLGLGALRFYSIATGVNLPFLVANPFFFAAINMVMLLATAFTVYRCYPSDAEMKKISEYEKIESEILQLQNENAKAQSQITELFNYRDMLVNFAIYLRHIERELCQMVNKKYHELIGGWQHEDVVKRSDGVFPDCFNTPVTPLADEESTIFIIINAKK